MYRVINLCRRSVIYRVINLNRTCGIVSLSDVCTLSQAVWCVRSLTSSFVRCDVLNALLFGL